MDFIGVPTVRFQLLYAWFVIGHGRREIIHFGVTAHPTSPWFVQELREAFPDNTSPRFLIYDNDSIFSERATESWRPAPSVRVARSGMTIGAAYPIRRIKGRRTNFENRQAIHLSSSAPEAQTEGQN
jgi:hypothetical protein